MNQKQIVEQFLRSITIIYFALLMGQILLVGTFTFLKLGLGITSTEDIGELKFIFQIIIPVGLIFGFGMGQFLMNKRLPSIRQLSFTEKLNQYRSLLIIRCALLEGFILFAAVVYYLSDDYIFLGYVFLGVMGFLFLRPTRFKLQEDLEINLSDI